MYDPKIIHIQSGNHDYYKIVGTPQELNKISRRTNEPVKDEQGQNPAHVDVPARKINYAGVEVKDG